MLTETVSKRERLAVFGPAWDSAGVRGFSNEKYWFHDMEPGLSFGGSTFVTKTVTTWHNLGNTLLDSMHRPLQLFPSSIKIKFLKGMVLNAVGLSNPGIQAFLRDEYWFSIREPFFISYAPVLRPGDKNAEDEVPAFVRALKRALDCKAFASKHIGIQLDVTCPSTDIDIPALIARVEIILDQLSTLELPIVVKLNLLVEPEMAAMIARHPACTGLCISNSIPFGEVLPPLFWNTYFPNGSPLLRRFGVAGRLSGAPLRDLVRRWVMRFREIDPFTYLNVGGGLMKPSDLDFLQHKGVNSIFIGSVAILRPWRVQGIIDRAHAIL